MTKIAVFGKEEFTLGFELVGMENYKLNQIEEVMNNKTKDYGIFIINKDDFETLQLKIKIKLEKSIKPIMMIIDEKGGEDLRLKKMIKKSLGIDLK